jgi:uncharacterized RDD family membrane protein YckC
MNGATYAGFWKRFLAHIIDQFVVGIAEAIVLIPIFLVVGLGAVGASASEDFEGDPSMFMALLAGPIMLAILIAVVGTWLYYALMESSKLQGTLGKMALGIKVTDMAGNKLSFGRATGRYFAKIISGLILGIGYLMAGFTQQKQALHDIIASCLVVTK